MQKILRLFSSMALAAVAGYASSAFALTPSSCTRHKTISTFISDVFYQSPESLVDSLKGTSFNTVATTIAWSVVEKRQGKIDLSMYYPQLDALTKAGYCIIALVDTSGRAMHSDVAKILAKDINTIPTSSRPDWIGSVAPMANSIDFFDQPAGPLDFEDKTSMLLVQNLYETILPRLRSRYGQSILAISPCVTGECEIKYSQTGFRWQSYGPQSQRAFRQWLKLSGVQPASMPIMNYGNHLKDGNPRVQPLYPMLQEFRENSLRGYVCALTGIIRRSGMQSIGYFGQTFAFPDGIYATGTIEKTSSCFDIAAIDYNFYNGYGVELKSEIPAFLADYALSLGYGKVLIGLYMERFRDPHTSLIDPRGYAVLGASLNLIRPDQRIAGIEIGNLTGNELQKVGDVESKVEVFTRSPSGVRAGKRVAVYASIANSYLWEGEWSNDRQIMQDDLLATYAKLKSIPNVQVSILTDAQLREQPSSIGNYDLIVLPHVTTMPAASRSALVRYYDGGGKLLSDIRVDEYLSDGSPNPDSPLRKIFGIGASQAFVSSVTVSEFGIQRTLGKQAQYVDGFMLASLPGYKIAMPRVGGAGEGLTLTGPRTTMFGFMPLLVEGGSSEWARSLFQRQVERLINQRESRRLASNSAGPPSPRSAASARLSMPGN
jgi:hypothetical protein